MASGRDRGGQGFLPVVAACPMPCSHRTLKLRRTFPNLDADPSRGKSSKGRHVSLPGSQVLARPPPLGSLIAENSGVRNRKAPSYCLASTRYSPCSEVSACF